MSALENFHRRGRFLVKSMTVLLEEVADVLEKGSVVVYRRTEGGEVKYITRHGIRIDNKHALAISMGDPKRLLAEFLRVLSGYSNEIMRSSEPNLTMSGLRTVIELYERKICFLICAKPSAARRDTLRYFYLNSFISSTAEGSKQLATSIKLEMPDDPIIKRVNIGDIGLDNAEAEAAKQLQKIFGTEYAKYQFGDKRGYARFTRIVHGYVHANHFNFRAAQLRQNKASGLISMNSLKSASIIVVLMETLLAATSKVSDPKTRMDIEKKIARKKILAEKFMEDLKSKKYE